VLGYDRAGMSATEPIVDQLQRLLADANARFQALADALVEALIVIAADGRIETVNRAAERMFGYAAAELIGQNVSMLMPMPMRAEHDGYIARYLRTGEAKIIGYGRTVSALRRDGREFPADLAVGEVASGDGARRFIGLIRDISHAVETERALREREAELAHAGRVSLVGEMASGVAHEINQPLTAISAYAQALQRHYDAGRLTSPDFREGLAQIIVQADRAAEIVRRLRSFVRKREPRYEPIDLNALLQGVTALVAHDAQMRRVRLEFDLAAELPPVTADTLELQQVVVNLLRNAFDAMAAVSDAARRVRLRSRQADPRTVEIRVTDWGCGVPPDRVKSLFVPFFTTKADGMGLGLSISHSIVTGLGGRLWHEPNHPTGSAFCFTLPTTLAG
jgi:two-component system sensor kinase FixL